MIGTSIAHYSITAKIGAGGMGEVWRATDTKLNRDVALKILPELFSADAQRMARFQREAQVLASLNHANIAAIYGVEESEGRRALVLELVEGEDLSQRLQAGSIPIEETLDIARQIAEALEAAHEKGVVHRDLKPANVKLTPGGTVKVLDFGLAKALEGDPATGTTDPSQSLSPTLTVAATRAGIVLGTAAYMSPEQAKGKVVDRRSDIFSFGALLFEMLARKQVFGGETISDTLASVLKVEPEWELLPSGTPQAVVDLLRRCLEKDPKLRLQSIGEARIALTAAVRGEASTLSGSPVGPMAETAPGAVTGAEIPVTRGPGRTAWAVSLLAVGLLAGVAGWLLKPPAGALPVRRFLVAPEDLDSSYRNQPVISPDGARVAYLAGDRLWIQDLDQIEPREVPSSRGARAICWSPDGASLAFGAGGNLYRVAAVGGPPAVVTELKLSRLDATAWSPDGFIYLAPSQGSMYRVPAQGGDPQEAIPLAPEGESDFHTPAPLPDGSGILYSVHRTSSPDTIEAWRGGERRIILRIEEDRIENAMVSPEGYLIFFRRTHNAGIWAAPFSMGRLELTGDPFLLDPAGSFPSVAADGTFLYTIDAGSDLRQLVWLDRTGSLAGTVGQPQEGLVFPELSPDATRILVSENPGGDNRDIWMYDVERGTRTRLTFGDDSEWQASWLPGGERVAYSLSTGPTGETWSRAADGTDEPVKMGDFYLPSFREGLSLASASRRDPATGRDLVAVKMDGEEVQVSPLFIAPENQSDSQLSPDGQLVAYVSDESGKDEVYLKKFPGGEGKWQVSLNGGAWPRWSSDGREVYYVENDPRASLMVVKITARPSVRLSTPEKLFDEGALDGLRLGAGPRDYDVHPDGERFLVVRSVGQERDSQPRIAVTQNWLKAWGK